MQNAITGQIGYISDIVCDSRIHIAGPVRLDFRLIAIIIIFPATQILHI